MINLNKISEYYASKLQKYGDSPKGVDWKDKKTQTIRFTSFDSLFKEENFSVLDYGCGKADHYIYFKKNFNKIKYYGVDISEAMITFCKKKFSQEQNCSFFTKLPIKKADYIIANGTFTVKHSFGQKEWQEYVFKEIDKLYKIAKKGIGFNLMTSYVDFKAKRLFYMDPSKTFRILKKKYKYVDIIHSYPLYEYTVIIRKK